MKLSRFLSLKALFLAQGLSHAAEMDTLQTYFKSVADMGEKLATCSMEKTPQENTLVSPLGPTQLLYSLYQALSLPGDINRQYQLEIKEFVGHVISSEGAQNFNRKIPEDTETFMYKFLNRKYIFPADEKIKIEATKDLKKLGTLVISFPFEEPAQAAETINKIVDDDTHGLYKSIISPDATPSLGQAIFMSTFYVKANWKPKFIEVPLDFGFEKSKKAVTGLNAHQHIYFAETGSDFILNVIGSQKVYLMIKMSKTDEVTPITASDIEQVIHIPTVYADLTIPAFTIKTTVDLTDMLRDKLPHILDGNTQFKTTLTDNPLRISKFLQKNKLIVSKDGIEGASVTGIFLKTARFVEEPPLTHTVVIDKPFSYAVYQGIGKNRETRESAHFLHLFAGNVWNVSSPAIT